MTNPPSEEAPCGAVRTHGPLRLVCALPVHHEGEHQQLLIMRWTTSDEGETP